LAIEQSPGTGESKNLGSETLRGLEEILLRCADAAGKSKLAGVAEFLLFASLVVSGYVELTAGLTLTGLGLAGHPSGMEYGTIKDGLILLALSGISYASYKKMDVG